MLNNYFSQKRKVSPKQLRAKNNQSACAISHSFGSTHGANSRASMTSHSIQGRKSVQAMASRQGSMTTSLTEAA